MARKTTLLAMLFALAVAGCVDPSKVVEVVESVADQAAQVGQSLIPDTHEALYGAMLECEEKGTDIVEGLTGVQAARDARPRLRALGKQYRHLANRYLTLDLPDEEGWKRLVEVFKEREHKLALRKYELNKRLFDGDKDLQFAVNASSSLIFGRRSAFDFARGGLLMEQRLGAKFPLPPDDTSPEQLAEREKVLLSAAAKLDKLAASMEAALREGSIKSRLKAIRAQTDDLLRDVDKVVQFPPLKRGRHHIRLDPAYEQVEDAILRYAEVSGAAHSHKDWREFFAVNFDILQATLKLQAPQLFKNMEEMAKKSPAEFANQMAENSVRIAGPRPGAGPPAPPDFANRPGPGGGFAQRPPAGAGAPAIPAMPTLEGPDVVTIQIPNFPAKRYQEVTQLLQKLTSRTNCRASNRGGQYIFSVRYTGDLRELARKIDFGSVTKTDDATRTITVEIPNKS